MTTTSRSGATYRRRRIATLAAAAAIGLVVAGPLVSPPAAALGGGSSRGTAIDLDGQSPPLAPPSRLVADTTAGNGGETGGVAGAGVNDYVSWYRFTTGSSDRAIGISAVPDGSFDVALELWVAAGDPADDSDDTLIDSDGPGGGGVTLETRTFAAGTTYYIGVGTPADNTVGGTQVGSAELVLATAPDAPVVGTATTAGPTSATVVFAPGADNHSAITGYTITCSANHAAFAPCPGGGSEVSASPALVTGLTPGLTYTFRVTATNAIGSSSPVSSNALAMPTAPGTGQSSPGTGPRGPDTEQTGAEQTGAEQTGAEQTGARTGALARTGAAGEVTARPATRTTGPDAATLSYTGAGVLPTTGLAFAIIALGGGAVLLARRRPGSGGGRR